MPHLVIGYGEVGKGLFEVLTTEQSTLEVDAVDPVVKDIPARNHERYDVIHICFPFKNLKGFTDAVMAAMGKYALPGTIVIIHSTVPVGTTNEVTSLTGHDSIVHSPIRGVHPNLALGIRVFPKYFGGKAAHAAAMIFEQLGIATRTYENSDTTEAIKLWDTTQYGWMIVLAKEIAIWCKKHGVSFEDVYRIPNQDYNDGYTDLDRPEVVRPYLKDMPGAIGGHCVIPNCGLLGDSFIAQTVLNRNAVYELQDSVE